jgi:hypothetical protein
MLKIFLNIIWCIFPHILSSSLYFYNILHWIFCFSSHLLCASGTVFIAIYLYCSSFNYLC